MRPDAILTSAYSSSTPSTLQLGTYTKPVDAGIEMLRLLLDEPEQAGDVWIEPVEIDVVQPSER